MAMIMFSYVIKQRNSTMHFFTRESRMLRASLLSSGRMSVRLSQSWSVSKQCKLGSQNLYCGLPQGLQFIKTKFRATGCRGSPRTRASKRGTFSGKKRYHVSWLSCSFGKAIMAYYTYICHRSKMAPLRFCHLWWYQYLVWPMDYGFFVIILRTYSI